MAVKKLERGDNNGETQLEKQVTRLEEKDGAPRRQSETNDGTLAVNTGDLKLPQELSEEETKRAGFSSVDPAVLVILCFSLVFITVIAYVIWSGWEPPQR